MNRERDTLSLEVKPGLVSPSFALKRRWARRLSKGNVPIFTVMTTKGCNFRIQRGQMRIMQIDVEGKAKAEKA